MTVEAANAMDAGAERAVRPASAWRILFVFVALALASGAVGFLAMVRTGETDAPAVLDPAFEVGPLPFELEAVYAADLPFQQKLVRFAPRGAAPASEAKLEAPAANGTSGESRTIQWKRLAIAPPGAPPREAQLVLLGQLGKDGLRAYLEDSSWKPLDTLDDRGGSVAVDVGTFPWAGFDARYAVVRRFQPPDRYEDSARVDLSAHGRWCVLVMRWTPGETASKAVLVELAKAFRPRPDPEAK